MKPLNRVIALFASVAHLLAACSSSTHNQVQSAPTQPAATTTQSPAGNASATSPKAALDTSKMMVGWPPDTPGLREVVFNFQVTGNTDRILSDGESGFLIVQSEQTSDVAKLVFSKDKRAIYNIPPHQFAVYSIGAEILCKGVIFKVSEENRNQSEIYISIDGHDDFTRILIKSPVMNIDTCRTKDKWAELDSDLAPKGKLSTGEKVALGIVGAIVLLPVAIIFPPAAGMIVGHR